MPWYWTDDLAKALLASGQIDPETARRLSKTPVAIRGAESKRDQAAEEAVDDDELPLVA